MSEDALANAYKDSNIDITGLEECTTTDDVLRLCAQHLPEWIISHSSHFCKEIDQFNKNWKKVCDIIGCEKDQIFIVEFSPAARTNPHHQKILAVCNLLTKFGNIVRDYHDFELCRECDGTKLTKQATKKLKREYSEVCARCTPQLVVPK